MRVVVSKSRCFDCERHILMNSGAFHLNHEERKLEITTALIGVIVGFVLSELKESLKIRKRATVHFKAIKAEIEFCSQMAQVFIRDKVAAPLYRLPTKAYEVSLPQLLADAATNEHELRAIQRFYMQVESLNRGLCQAELARNDKDRMNEEFSRNYTKAKYLLSTGETTDSFFTEAHNLLQKRCKN